jgi:DegV family protein with EDD domain
VIAVVTDSAASLPPATAADLGIEVVPMYLRFGDEVYRDGAEIGDFYERLARGEVWATSAPSPGDFLEAFQRTGSEEIVCVTIAQSLSGIYQAARLAAEMTPVRVEVVDSGNASLAQAFVAIAAARTVRDGGTIEEAASRAREAAGRAHIVAVIDTFEYLQRSGRVRRLQAYAATMLGIKPVFRFSRGEITAVARPRTKRRAIERVAEEALGIIESAPVRIAAVHAAAEDEARNLLEHMSSRVDVVESLVAEFTPGMGVHTGPGLVGLAFVLE